MRKPMLAFILLGVIPTAFALWLHPYFCKYDMNILCFIKCNIPLVLGASVAIMVGGDDHGEP